MGNGVRLRTVLLRDRRNQGRRGCIGSRFPLIYQRIAVNRIFVQFLEALRRRVLVAARNGRCDILQASASTA